MAMAFVFDWVSVLQGKITAVLEACVVGIEVGWLACGRTEGTHTNKEAIDLSLNRSRLPAEK